MPCPRVFRMAVELYPKADLEGLFLPLIEKWGGNRPLLIRAFLAKELGRTDEVERIYQEKKRELEEAERVRYDSLDDSEPEIDEDYANHYLYLQDLISEYAELCEVLGRFDEAIEYILAGMLNHHILLHEPFAVVVEGREDRDEIYERVLLKHSTAGDHFHRALAHEKLGRADEAREHYYVAMLEGERCLDFGEAFSIARRLGNSKKAEAYDDVATHLYAHRHI